MPRKINLKTDMNSVVHIGWGNSKLWPEFKQFIGAHCDDIAVAATDVEALGRARQLLVAAMDQTHVRGATRQVALQELDESFARLISKALIDRYELAYVDLQILPHLWSTGKLKGVNYAVLVDRSPLDLLHRQLEFAAQRHNAVESLRFFRANAALVHAEDEALAMATQVVTPHAFVGTYLEKRFGKKVEKLQWLICEPTRPARSSPGFFLFADKGLPRKGAHDFLAASDACSDLTYSRLSCGGEFDEFWRGSRVVEAGALDDALDSAECVVLPAYVEHRPALLIRAVELGIQVICTRECGLEKSARVRVVPAGDFGALVKEIQSVSMEMRNAVV